MASTDLVTSDSARISTVAKYDASIHGPLTEAEDLVAELRLTDAVDNSADVAVATSPINATSTSVEGLAAVSQDEDLSPEQEAAAEQCAQAFVDYYEHVGDLLAAGLAVLMWFKQSAVLMLCEHTISNTTSMARTSLQCV